MIRTTEALLSVAEAEALIGRCVTVLPAEHVAVAECAGRILREDIVAERDQPPFDRATMDGIALASADRASRLTISGIAAAGAPPLAYEGLGSAVEIMTGAVVPAGCDVVVPVENTTRDGDDVIVADEANRDAGRYIHARGSDHLKDHPLVRAGDRIDATRMAVLVSAGCVTPLVTRTPRITVLATGDELVDVDQPVAAHQIRRSNDYALDTLLSQHGWADVERVHVSDRREAVARALAGALDNSDVLIVSGGVSKGRYDYVADELKSAGVDKIFHRVAQRPGKPMWFGQGPKGQLVFALPGNPVSALVCLRRYVINALRRQSGESGDFSAPQVVLNGMQMFKPALTWFAAATVCQKEGVMRATVHPVNTSGDFTALVGTDGVLELPANTSTFDDGSFVAWYPW